MWNGYEIRNDMELRRDILDKLKAWKDSAYRKPLVIKGARQVGKTWIMREFGRKYFEHTAYFNFDDNEALCREFENTKDPKRLIPILSLYTEVPILPGKTLIVFDEVQQCNKALNSLKYFCEDAPEYHIMAAGSLLGVTLSRGDSFPVGKVEFLNMYPVTFKEFLYDSDAKLYEWIDSINRIEPLPEIVLERLNEEYRRYAICGGIPAAVVAMLTDQGTERVETEQRNVLQAYAMDFSKHAPVNEVPRISAVWESIPTQLSRENRKFLFKLVKPGARAREYESSLQWLQAAGLITKVTCSTYPGLPLSAYDDITAFKIYMFDSGLLRTMAGLPPEVIWTESPLYREFKGALAENSVLQQLLPQLDVAPRYWTSSGKAEVDFIIQNRLEIVPLEVKAASNTSGQSLSVYIKNYQPEKSVILSTQNMNRKGNVLHIPIALASWLTQILSLR